MRDSADEEWLNDLTVFEEWLDDLTVFEERLDDLTVRTCSRNSFAAASKLRLTVS